MIDKIRAYFCGRGAPRTGLQESVRQELHRLIPNSSLPENVNAPDLIIPYNDDRHKPFRDALWYCGILGSFAGWEKSFYEVVAEITTGNLLTVMVETTTDEATLEARIRRGLAKSRADCTVFAVMPEMFEYAKSFGYAYFHPWLDWEHDALIVDAVALLDYLREHQGHEEKDEANG